MYETARLVITVRAYPAISMRHGEAVCLAGFRTDQLMQASWVRLYPLSVRDLPPDTRLRTWDEVEVRITKTADDHRPESFTPDRDSLRIVGHLDPKKTWEARRHLVDLLPRSETMLQVLAEREATNTSLAVVQPGQILDLEVSARSASEMDELREKAKAVSAQGDLFSSGPKEPLEPIPFNFHYVVQYPDESEPRRLKLIDWEINQTWRKWRYIYPDPEIRIREKWLNEVTGPDRDSLFFVGNQKRFPDQFLLLGIFWPPKIR